MEFYRELIRIADTLPLPGDRAILYSAAALLAPGPTPSHESCSVIPGWGVQHVKAFLEQDQCKDK